MSNVIEYLKIENFRSIDVLELHDIKPFSVFAGANGSGKSNFFDALDFVSRVLRFDLEEALAYHGGVENIVCWRRDEEARKIFRFEVKFSHIEFGFSIDFINNKNIINKICQKANPDKIVILTDLECNPCATETKKRIGQEQIDLICVAKKALQFWYLADITALRLAFKKDDLNEIEQPELETETIMPWNYLKRLAQQHQIRGPGSNKIVFTKRMLEYHQFDISRAAAHPNCPSARYFLDKLIKLKQLDHTA